MRALSERHACPDGGVCHHECSDGSLRSCFRVACCAPLSGVYVNDRWPEFEPSTPAPAKAAEQEIPPCPICGTWTCAECGWKRTGASLSWVHSCHRCGGTRGAIVPTRHRNEQIRADHAADARKVLA